MPNTLWKSAIIPTVICLNFLMACENNRNLDLADPPANPPNVLYILVDQQRQDGVGAYGQPGIQTPNLDQLAADGIRFNNSYTAQPVCAPNRGSMFSGLYPFNHGARENTWDLDTHVELLPDRFRAAGYTTAYFGKWHLGDPARDAFDEMPIYPNDGRGRGHYYPQGDSMVYQTDVISNHAISFMEANRDNPFFMVVSLYPPHPPYSVPAKYEALYADIFPDDENRRKYYAMGTAVDDAVGRLVSALETNDLMENTLIVYTTEHGHYFEHRWNDHSKRLCYDVTANIPLLMKFPDTIPAGQVSEMLINAVDLSPTILGLVQLPSWENRDGADLSRQIVKDSNEMPAFTAMVNVPYIDKSQQPHQPMLSEGEERCVATQNWKMILSTVRAPELYDLTEDDDEVNNLWDQPATYKTKELLLDQLTAWQQRTGDQLILELDR